MPSLAQDTLHEPCPAVPDIRSLTAQMARGDEDAYRRFYEAYFHRLFGYLLVLTRDEETAREALQATLLRVVRHAKRFESEAAFWSWLTVLARSSAFDEKRKSRRYLGFLSRFLEHSQTEREALDEEPDARLQEMLEAHLAALPDDERELIRRKYFEGASVRDIALQSQMTEGAIESRLVRIRRKLKDLILRGLKHER